MSEIEELKLGVLGLGHVGLPTALGLANLGWSVVGIDDNQEKAQEIEHGIAPFYEPDLQQHLDAQLANGRFRVEYDMATVISEATILFVCVGTPQSYDGGADLSQIEQVARSIAVNLKEYRLIVEKSTTPVSTAQQIRQSIRRYAQPGKEKGNDPEFLPDFDVAVNPEFLREGTAISDFFNPDRIVLGVETERARDLLIQVYLPLLKRIGESVDSRILITDMNTAEIIKHASNAFLATKISYVNMVSDLCDATGANVDLVAKGIGLDPRIGPHFLKAGIGYGGYCLPKDVRAFNKIAKDNGVDSSLIGEVDKINIRRIDRYLDKVRKALWVIRGKQLAVWGLSFKPGTDDIRESPSITIVKALIDEGARLRIYDPRSMDEVRASFPEILPHLVFCESAEEATEGAEALLVLTEWPEFLNVDLDKIRSLMAVPLMVDGRNHFDPSFLRQLGFDYYGMGVP